LAGVEAFARRIPKPFKKPYGEGMSIKEMPKAGGINVKSSGDERRRSPRFPFSAVAEVMDRRSGARMPVRIADISQDGCYADALNVFPTGTHVVISIRHANLEFRTMATVAYALPSMGMGVQFAETTPEMRAVLERWIAEACGEIAVPFGAASLTGDAKAPRAGEQRVLHQLLELLIQKRLLTQTEGTDLLEELHRGR
jgi:hypothetical protein